MENVLHITVWKLKISDKKNIKRVFKQPVRNLCLLPCLLLCSYSCCTLLKSGTTTLVTNTLCNSEKHYTHVAEEQSVLIKSEIDACFDLYNACIFPKLNVP